MNEYVRQVIHRLPAILALAGGFLVGFAGSLKSLEAPALYPWMIFAMVCGLFCGWVLKRTLTDAIEKAEEQQQEQLLRQAQEGIEAMETEQGSVLDIRVEDNPLDAFTPLEIKEAIRKAENL